MKDFTGLIDLVSERVGGVALAANDEFFAPKENLLTSSPPVFVEGKFTDRGKWMDGWETRRRREPGNDWCIVKLGLAGRLRGVVVDTAHFKGIFPAQCSLEECSAKADASPESLDLLLDAAMEWVEVLPKSDLKGDSRNLFAITSSERFTHVRLNIFPDGGVARLRVFGEVLPDWAALSSRDGELDLAAVENGGLVVACSDMFFGSRHNLIFPGRAANMGEGWETQRRRGPGHDWAVIKLGTVGAVQRIEVDTAHFKGNFPESCALEGCRAQATGAGEVLDVPDDNASWKEILPRTPLGPDTLHLFAKELISADPVTHVRFKIFPDGGVSRLRVFGKIERDS